MPGAWPVEFHDTVRSFDECPASQITRATVRWLARYNRWKSLRIRPKRPSGRWVEAMLVIEGEFARMQQERIERLRRRSASAGG